MSQTKILFYHYSNLPFAIHQYQSQSSWD